MLFKKPAILFGVPTSINGRERVQSIFYHSTHTQKVVDEIKLERILKKSVSEYIPCKITIEMTFENSHVALVVLVPQQRLVSWRLHALHRGKKTLPQNALNRIYDLCDE